VRSNAPKALIVLGRPPAKGRRAKDAFGKRSRSKARQHSARATKERVVTRRVAMLMRPIDWAVGGFHLMDASASEIAHRVGALQELNAAHAVPTH
jgi:hypothetical protein